MTVTEQDSSGVELSQAEKIAAEVALAFARNNYVVDGEPVKDLVIDKVYGIVSTAVVTAKSERADKAVIRPKLMSSVFPDVPGPESWDEEDDPKVAAKVYGTLDSYIWRICDPNYSGPIQARLNGDLGMILCRTKATAGGVAGVYVTKDIDCLKIDFSTPFKEKLEREAKRHALNLAMATMRLPEFVNVWESELKKGLAQAKRTSDAALFPALDAVRNGDGE